ncbi:MAG: Fur family transcriptional regulator [Myxococcota bacterium]
MPPSRSHSQTLHRAREQLALHLARKGLKQTRQRDAILEAFVASSGHVTSDDLYERVRAAHPEIGAATVYRTLKLLCDAGVASARFFRDGVTLYEYEDDRHHDHLICVGCGEIVEFESEVIEREQSRVSERFGYRLTHHRHHLFGYCPRCRKGS